MQPPVQINIISNINIIYHQQTPDEIARDVRDRLSQQQDELRQRS